MADNTLQSSTSGSWLERRFALYSRGSSLRTECLAGVTGSFGTLALAYAGAFGASVLVYAIGSLGAGGGSPVRLILAGVALGAVLAGITSAIVLTDRARFADQRGHDAGDGGRKRLEIILVEQVARPQREIPARVALAHAPAHAGVGQARLATQLQQIRLHPRLVRFGLAMWPIAGARVFCRGIDE